MNLPGVNVLVPAFPYDVKGLVKTALRTPEPVIFLMHKRLTGIQGPVGGPDELVPFGQANVVRAGTDCTRHHLRRRRGQGAGRRGRALPRRVPAPRSSTCGLCPRSTWPPASLRSKKRAEPSSSTRRRRSRARAPRWRPRCRSLRLSTWMRRLAGSGPSRPQCPKARPCSTTSCPVSQTSSRRSGARLPPSRTGPTNHRDHRGSSAPGSRQELVARHALHTRFEGENIAGFF